MSNVVNISEAANLALHAAIILAANPGKPLSIPDIVGRLQVSDNHLSKVMQRLTRAGIVSSTRGRNGGFLLRGDPAQVTLLDVYEAIEGPQAPKKCLLTTPRCCGECVFADFTASVNEMFARRLRSLKLSDVTGTFR